MDYNVLLTYNLKGSSDHEKFSDEMKIHNWEKLNDVNTAIKKEYLNTNIIELEKDIIQNIKDTIDELGIKYVVSFAYQIGKNTINTEYAYWEN